MLTWWQTQNLRIADALGASLAQIAAAMHYHGTRWTKQYDTDTDTPYYYDRATGLSRWERPPDYDEDPQVKTTTISYAQCQTFDACSLHVVFVGSHCQHEQTLDSARYHLKQFYAEHNPSKTKDVDAIVQVYRNDLRALFQNLATQYGVTIDCSWLAPGLEFQGLHAH